MIAKSRLTAIGYATLALARPYPACAQLASGPDDGVSTWRIVASLALCLGLAVACAFALRARLGGGGMAPLLTRQGAQRLHLRESLRMGAQVRICIVACDEGEMLIATTPTGAQWLRDLTPVPQATSE